MSGNPLCRNAKARASLCIVIALSCVPYMYNSLVTVSTISGCGPRTGIGQIISQNVTLFHNITASSELLFSNGFLYSADLFINYGRREGAVWCSAQEDPNPHINITFVGPVVITGLLLGGYTSTPLFNYVDNFTVEYAPSEDSDFVLYRVIGEDSEIQVSTVIVVAVVALIPMIYLILKP